MNITIRNIIFNIKQYPLEYITMIVAFLGATFASDADNYIRGLGFLLWIFSNGYMLVGFLKSRNIPYSLIFIGYECMNIRGVWHSWYG